MRIKVTSKATTAPATSKEGRVSLGTYLEINVSAMSQSIKGFPGGSLIQSRAGIL